MDDWHIASVNLGEAFDNIDCKKIFDILKAHVCKFYELDSYFQFP